MKKLIKSSKLLLALTLMFIFSIAGTATSFALLPKEEPYSPSLPENKFVFIHTHIHTEGIGDVGGGMMIDFPTYTYSAETKTLRSQREVPDYGPETKVIIGSGRSISGTAGGGAATGLRAYSSFSSSDVFSIDYRFSVRILMNGEYRYVRVGEKWTETVETKPTVGDGKLLITYTIENFGVVDKANFIQPTPLPTKIVSTPTPTPTSIPTPSAQVKKFTVSGYVRPEPPPCKCNNAPDFKVEIPELNISTTTDGEGYFKFDGVPENNNGYKFKISKPGYLTREIDNVSVCKELQINAISIFPGDLDNNGAINMMDMIEVAKSYNLTASDPKFNKTADFDYNDVINMSDIMIMAANFNKTSSSYIAPVIVNTNYITMKNDDTINIVLKEGGIMGLTWKCSISDENIIKLYSQIPCNKTYPDEYGNCIWVFKAISAGEAVITFTPSYGNTLEKYIVKVTDSVSPTTTPTATPDKEPKLINSKDLNSTLISADPEEKVSSGKNIVYCPTFQMAWDELKSLMNGNVQLSGKPPLAAALNNGFPIMDSLSYASYLCRSGYGQTTINKINAELIEKFGASAPQITDKINPADFISYAFLNKNISFAKTFESMTTPLNFKSSANSSNVKAFGINPYSKKFDDLSKQVSIYDYKNDNDFIIKLLPQDDQDEIILAKVKPDETLYKTYSSVMKRINTGNSQSLAANDSLKIPVLNFNIGHNYSELEGQGILNPGFESYTITKAYQRTRFKLDENGALLASEAIIIIKYGGTDKPKNLVFDGPFMIILKEKNAVNPYLMLWIDNPELLVNQ